MTLHDLIQAIPNFLWSDGQAWTGLVVTLQLFFCAAVLGLPLALVLALTKVYAPKPVQWLVAAYSYFFRGTPLFLQLMLIYYGLAQFEWMTNGWQQGNGFWLLFREALFCAVLAYVLNTAAYALEVLAGALQNYPQTERVAAESFGMSPRQVLQFIVLPGTLRRVIPMFSNEMVFLLHATALASTVTLMDVTGVARNLYAKTYSPFYPFLMAAVVYMAATWVILYGFHRAEQRWLKFLQPRQA
jgi:histidine transport system permease protein